MCHCEPLQRIGPHSFLCPWLYNIDRHLADQPSLGQLSLQHSGSKRRGDYSTSQPGPQRGNRANVVFMRMRNDHGGDIVATFGHECRIGCYYTMLCHSGMG